MHSRRKGISGSKKPIVKKQPEWVRYGAKEVEMLVQKLAKDGKSSSEIGIFLRDSYGIPSVQIITKKSIVGIMKEKGLAKELPEDLFNMVRKSVAIRKHLEENVQDQTAKRGLMLTESKIRRLVKYYKRSHVLPQDWKYDAKSLRLYVG